MKITKLWNNVANAPESNQKIIINTSSNYHLGVMQCVVLQCIQRPLWVTIFWIQFLLVIQECCQKTPRAVPALKMILKTIKLFLTVNCFMPCTIQMQQLRNNDVQLVPFMRKNDSSAGITRKNVSFTYTKGQDVASKRTTWTSLQWYMQRKRNIWTSINAQNKIRKQEFCHTKVCKATGKFMIALYMSSLKNGNVISTCRAQ